jgi:hypothetical protein
LQIKRSGEVEVALDERRLRPEAPRSVLELSVPEQIVIWSLRRYRASDARLEALALTYRQVFGLAEVERALAAFGRVVLAIERNSRQASTPAVIDRLHLSPTECSVIRLIGAIHAGDDATADGLAAWLVAAPGRDALLGAAKEFAECLAAAGQRLTADGMDALPLVHPARFDMPSVARASELTVDEVLVLQAVRIWVKCAREDRCGWPDMMDHLAANGAGNAASSLHGVLYNSSVAAARGIDVRCPRCPNLSPDEARLLHAIACGQRRLTASVRELLSSWLSPAAVRLTMDAVLGAGRELQLSRVVLPLRTWDFTQLEQSALPPESERSAARVLH